MSLMAQDEGNEDDLDDLDLSVSATETDTESKYFSLGAGFIGQFHFTNLDDMATDLEAAGLPVSVNLIAYIHDGCSRLHGNWYCTQPKNRFFLEWRDPMRLLKT
jgi:hypothetical protein